MRSRRTRRFWERCADRSGDDHRAGGIRLAVGARSGSEVVSGRRHLLLHLQGRSRSLYAGRDPLRLQQPGTQLLGHDRAARPDLVSVRGWRLVTSRVPICAREFDRGRDAQWPGDIPLQGRSSIEFALSDRATDRAVLHQGSTFVAAGLVPATLRPSRAASWIPCSGITKPTAPMRFRLPAGTHSRRESGGTKLASFDGTMRASDIVLSGLDYQGTFYLKGCQSAGGRLPWCDRARFGSGRPPRRWRMKRRC